LRHHLDIADTDP